MASTLSPLSKSMVMQDVLFGPAPQLGAGRNTSLSNFSGKQAETKIWPKIILSQPTPTQKFMPLLHQSINQPDKSYIK
jgi:hypothetical protein